MSAGPQAGAAQSEGADEIALVVPDADPVPVPGPDPAVTTEPERAGRWAIGVRRLTVDARLGDAPSYNLVGRRLTGPQQGFGWLWERRYRARLGPEVAPTEVISIWRAEFGSLWPSTATFFGTPLGPLDAGVVAPIGVSTGPGLTLDTGILVLYADDESFTFMTPEGHPFAGWITFSAVSGPAGTVARIDVLVRPNDPIYHLGWPVMKRQEDRFWAGTLRNLATRVGAPPTLVTETSRRVDAKVQWHNWSNLWFNAGVRSVLHLVTRPRRPGVRDRRVR